MTKAKKGATTPRGAGKASPGVGAYLAAVKGPARATFMGLRAAVLSAAPKGSEETISYRIPAVRHGVVLVWYAAFRDHCSFFPTAEIIREFRAELGPLATSKGTVRFPLGGKLPVTLIRRMVRARAARARAGAARK